MRLNTHPWRDRWRLQDLRIGVRLRLVFAIVLTLMFVGCLVSLWHLREIRSRVGKISEVERRMTAVLQLDNGVLTLINQLQRAADTRQRAYFEAEATRLLGALRSNTAWATQTLQRVQPDDKRQVVVLDSLISMLDSLPARVRSLVDLAQSDDWIALHARLLNQVDHTDDVVAALVNQIDENLAEARSRLLEEVQGAQRRTALVLGATGLLSLLVAALLGVVVTRSITRPLARLDVGTRALGKEHFSQVEVIGSDELAQLAIGFNRTARELQDLYAKMRLSEAYFRSLIENATDLIVIVNRTGRLSYASPSSIRVLGYSPDQLISEPVRDLVNPEEFPLADQVFAGDHVAAGGTRSFEFRFRHRDGVFRVLEGLATNLLDDPAVAGVVVNARDVTERRQAEQKIREREDQLRQAQKMEAIGQLAGGVAHDFNNLLTVINGYSEFLLGALDEYDPRYAYAKSIRDSGERAADLTRQLLAFGRKQMLRPAVLNLNDIVSEAETMLRRIIGEDIMIVCKPDPSLWGVEADVNQIHQVLMNLCGNARDAMPTGGRLSIETANVVLHTSLARSDVEVRAGRYVALAVSDTGHGMDEATQKRIFEPFFTTKEQGKGTGLGLATVYGIVRQSGGQITVDSVEGGGTTFRVYLPSVDRSAQLDEVEGPSPCLSGHETILLVEDELQVRRLASTSLKAHGYQVIDAGDGEEALHLHAAYSGTIHVLLTDVVMPGMTGVELSRRLLTVDPDLKVIFVSGYADNVILRHGVSQGEVTLLPKPYSLTALAAKVREILDPAEKKGMAGGAGN